MKLTCQVSVFFKENIANELTESDFALLGLGTAVVGLFTDGPSEEDDAAQTGRSPISTSIGLVPANGTKRGRLDVLVFLHLKEENLCKRSMSETVAIGLPR